MNQPAPGASAPPDVIYIIRHGEKPADPPALDPGQPSPAPGPPFGVDYEGNQDGHSLLPRGWQRSGALAVLFDPALGAPQAGLQVPAAMLSPSYGDPAKTTAHRTYQTIQGLSERLGIQIASDFAEGQEAQLAASVVSTSSGVVLICWEHRHIPALASSLPTSAGTVIPQKWQGDRFDVIWTFTLVPGSAPVHLRPDPPAVAGRRHRHRHPVIADRWREVDMPRFKARKADDMDEAAQVLQLAQQTANQAIADAQREAEEIRARARQEAEQIIADAKARAESLEAGG